MELLTRCKAQAQCIAANEECKVDKDCCGGNNCVRFGTRPVFDDDGNQVSETDLRICKLECEPIGSSCTKNKDCCKGDVCIKPPHDWLVGVCKKNVKPACKDIGGSCEDVSDCCDGGNRECKPLPVNGIWYERTCQIRKCQEEGENCSPKGSHGNCCDNLNCNRVGTCV